MTIMKKYYLLATALAAIVSCTSDEYVGENPTPTTSNQAGAILFTSDAPSITRGTSATDAAKINYQFKVFGVKTVSNSDQRVFATNSSGVAPYDVWYVENSGNTTLSNSSQWEYVGTANTAYGTSGYEVTLGAANQTIKYWDYSADSYTFQAWSDINTGTKANISAITKNTMTITDATPTQLGNLYVADLVTISKEATTNKSATNQYGGIVQFTFRKAATRVRLGIYETIPGYVVKDVVFHYTNNTDQTSNEAYLNGSFIGSSSSQATFNVTYNASTNKAELATTGNAHNTTFFDFGTFDSSTSIGTSSSSPTWANGGYINVFPNTTNIGNMTLTVDYKLYNQAANEVINVSGATATVPSNYMTWNPNYAYTYIFKISDNTNGSTGQSVVGLYPITFDAVIVDTADGTQETETMVTTPSITCYQADVAISSGFDASKDVAISVDVSSTITVKELTGAFDYTKTYDQQSYNTSFGSEGTITLASSSTTATFANANITEGKTYVIQAHTASADAYFVLVTSAAEVGPTP